MNRMRSFIILVGLLVALGVVPRAANAAFIAPPPPGMPPKGKIMLGVGGHALTPKGFDKVAGGRHELHVVTVAWNESRSWSDALYHLLPDAQAGGYRLVLHIGAARVDNGREGRSPGAVARGAADRYFLDMSRVINDSGQIIYLRPPAEMNGHWSYWSAFNKNGSRRDANHTTRQYRRAFIRIALIARGGDVAKINIALKRNGMPPLKTSKTYLPRSGRIAMVFNPQGAGSPNVRGNMPKDYYPGRFWVDYVANDVYVQHGRAAWSANQALYDRYKAVHPFMIAEYAPWGYDDPRFVRSMFAWASTHPRVVGMSYFNGTAGATFRLSSKPRSLAVYRSFAKRARFQCLGLTAFNETC
jgi:hypothetical protein